MIHKLDLHVAGQAGPYQVVDGCLGIADGINELTINGQVVGTLRPPTGNAVCGEDITGQPYRFLLRWETPVLVLPEP